MLIKAVICEDSESDAKTLIEYANEWAATKKNVQIECVKYDSPERLLGEYSGLSDTTVLFLDIIFASDRMSGIELAEKIIRMGAHPPIIFVSIDSHRTTVGYLIGAIDFILKPINKNRLFLSMNKLLKNIRGNYAIEISYRGKVLHLPQNSIIYLESSNHKVIFHTTKGEFETRTTLEDELRKLDENLFVRASRYYIVSVDKVGEIKKTHPHSVSVFNNGKEVSLSVGRAYIKSIIQARFEHVEGKVHG